MNTIILNIKDNEELAYNEWRRAMPDNVALWSETNKNREVSTGPFARPFAR